MGRWLALSAVLFGASALMFVVRLPRARGPAAMSADAADRCSWWTTSRPSPRWSRATSSARATQTRVAGGRPRRAGADRRRAARPGGAGPDAARAWTGSRSCAGMQRHGARLGDPADRQGRAQRPRRSACAWAPTTTWSSPSRPAELVARVDAVLRRVVPEPELEEPIAFDELELDPVARRVTVRGEEVALTVREYDLLLHFVRHPGQVFSRDQLMDAVWQYTFYTDTSTVTVHVRRLRDEDRERPLRAAVAADRVGRGLPVPAVSGIRAGLRAAGAGRGGRRSGVLAGLRRRRRAAHRRSDAGLRRARRRGRAPARRAPAAGSAACRASSRRGWR